MYLQVFDQLLGPDFQQQLVRSQMTGQQLFIHQLEGDLGSSFSGVFFRISYSNSNAVTIVHDFIFCDDKVCLLSSQCSR